MNKCYCPEANFLSEIIAVVAKGPLCGDIKTFECSENYQIKMIIKILTTCSILRSIDWLNYEYAAEKKLLLIFMLFVMHFLDYYWDVFVVAIKKN